MLKKRITVVFTVVGLMMAIIAASALPAMADTNYDGQTDTEIYHQGDGCVPQPYYDPCHRPNTSEY